MNTKVIGRHIRAGFLSVIVLCGLAFMFMFLVVFVPRHPPQGTWPLWLCGGLAFPSAIYTWRVVLLGRQAQAVAARTQALFLIGLGVFWYLLFMALYVLRTPTSKDAIYAAILLYLIVGPVPVLMTLHVSIRERQFRRSCPILYWPAVLLGLSPLLVFCFQVFR